MASYDHLELGDLRYHRFTVVARPRHSGHCAREDRYALAFSDLSALRVALDQELSEFDAALDGVREVAFFPPMTGG